MIQFWEYSITGTPMDGQCSKKRPLFGGYQTIHSIMYAMLTNKLQL